MTSIPILLYHSVSDDPPGWIAPFNVTPAQLREHLDLVRSAGATTITISGAVEALSRGEPLPPRPVVLSFDDGFRDWSEVAVPAMAERAMTASLYLTTGALEGSPSPCATRLPPARMLSWGELRDIRAAGFELGAHSHTHPELDVIRPGAAMEELTRPKALLEDALSAPVTSYAYPHGFATPAVTEMARRAGYSSACAVRNAISSERDDPFFLARLTVRPDTTLPTLESWIAGRGAPLAPMRRRLGTTAFRLYRRYARPSLPPPAEVGR
ncbi:MAG: polysaccharide deacetylase family protein [Acidimicrobiales bacterium]